MIILQTRLYFNRNKAIIITTEIAIPQGRVKK
jgi:hypothetical protein